MGQTQTHYDNLPTGEHSVLPVDGHSYQPKSLEYSLLVTESAADAELLSRQRSNLQAVYPLVAKFYNDGFTLNQLKRIPCVKFENKTLFQVILSKQAWDQLVAERWQLHVKRSFVTTEHSNSTITTHVTELWKDIQEEACRGARLISIEPTIPAAHHQVQEVDVFFDVPRHVMPSFFIYQAISVPVLWHRETHSGKDALECDWFSHFTTFLSQGWKLVEILFDSSVRHRVTVPSRTLTMNSVWVFEKKAADANSSLPQWEGVIVRYLHKSLTRFEDFRECYAKTSWNKVIHSMGKRGWELACIVTTPPSFQKGSLVTTIHCKILMFFQRPFTGNKPPQRLSSSGSGMSSSGSGMPISPILMDGRLGFPEWSILGESHLEEGRPVILPPYSERGVDIGPLESTPDRGIPRPETIPAEPPPTYDEAVARDVTVLFNTSITESSAPSTLAVESAVAPSISPESLRIAANALDNLSPEVTDQVSNATTSPPAVNVPPESPRDIPSTQQNSAEANRGAHLPENAEPQVTATVTVTESAQQGPEVRDGTDKHSAPITNTRSDPGMQTIPVSTSQRPPEAVRGQSETYERRNFPSANQASSTVVSTAPSSGTVPREGKGVSVEERPINWQRTAVSPPMSNTLDQRQDHNAAMSVTRKKSFPSPTRTSRKKEGAPIGDHHRHVHPPRQPVPAARKTHKEDKVESFKSGHEAVRQNLEGHADYNRVTAKGFSNNNKTSAMSKSSDPVRIENRNVPSSKHIPVERLGPSSQVVGGSVTHPRRKNIVHASEHSAPRSKAEMTNIVFSPSIVQKRRNRDYERIAGRSQGNRVQSRSRDDINFPESSGKGVGTVNDRGKDQYFVGHGPSEISRRNKQFGMSDGAPPVPPKTKRRNHDFKGKEDHPTSSQPKRQSVHGEKVHPGQSVLNKRNTADPNSTDRKMGERSHVKRPLPSYNEALQRKTQMRDDGRTENGTNKMLGAQRTRYPPQDLPDLVTHKAGREQNYWVLKDTGDDEVFISSQVSPESEPQRKVPVANLSRVDRHEGKSYNRRETPYDKMSSQFLPHQPKSVSNQGAMKPTERSGQMMHDIDQTDRRSLDSLQSFLEEKRKKPPQYEQVLSKRVVKPKPLKERQNTAPDLIENTASRALPHQHSLPVEAKANKVITKAPLPSYQEVVLSRSGARPKLKPSQSYPCSGEDKQPQTKSQRHSAKERQDYRRVDPHRMQDIQEYGKENVRKEETVWPSFKNSVEGNPVRGYDHENRNLPPSQDIGLKLTDDEGSVDSFDLISQWSQDDVEPPPSRLIKDLGGRDHRGKPPPSNSGLFFEDDTISSSSYQYFDQPSIYNTSYVTRDKPVDDFYLSLSTTEPGNVSLLTNSSKPVVVPPKSWHQDDNVKTWNTPGVSQRHVYLGKEIL